MWVGVAMTNVLKRLVPCGGLENFVGNNPFSVAVPVGKFPGVLDMANSVVAHHKIIS
ncbi:MAG: Ldh family oxidoreductase [Deltaproteobacteria bacterium]|nr:Ldh family oxidoreductase [Deltaproteobacteria bacterium]